MPEDPTPSTPADPASPDAKAREQDKTLTTGGEQSKSGSGLSTGVETGGVAPGNSQGANSAR